MSSIALRAKKCVGLFEDLVELLGQPEHQQAYGISDAVATDALGRFKIWGGNIGAFQAQDVKSSLDFRLRDTPKISTQILEILDDLTESLADACSIASDARENRKGVSFGVATEARDSNLDQDEDQTDEEELSEIREIFESIQDAINNLFRYSIIIRNNTNRDRYAKASAAALSAPFNDEFDISHVWHKFPTLKSKKYEWLIERLGKAITQRRQYLRYCRVHRDKTWQDPEPKPMLLRPEFSLPKAPNMLIPSGRSDFSKPTSTLAPTQASTLLLTSAQIIEEEMLDDAQSQTSYATSTDEESTSHKLNVIELEDVSKGLRHFECPYCWQIQASRSQKSWKKHVLSDLKPYVCTFEECELKLFSDRQTWFSHELKDHRKEWNCIFCTQVPFDKAATYCTHLASRHPQAFTDEQFPALLEMSQRPVLKISPTDCPFCDDWEQRLRAVNSHIPASESLVVTSSQFQHHVGAHMEQLALFAIPRGYTEEGEADSANAAPQIDSDASSLDSLAPDPETAENFRKCEDILDRVMEAAQSIENQEKRTLQFPVFNASIPGLGRVQVLPLDFEKISQKLQIGAYPTVKDFFNDIVLMFALRRIRDPDINIYAVVEGLFAESWGKAEGINNGDYSEIIQLINEAEKQIKWYFRWAAYLQEEPPWSAISVRSVGIQLRDGGHVVRRFKLEDEFEILYAFVECYELIKGRTGLPSVGIPGYRKLDGRHEYDFRLRFKDSPTPPGLFDLQDNGTVKSKLRDYSELVVVDLLSGDPLQTIPKTSAAPLTDIPETPNATHPQLKTPPRGFIFRWEHPGSEVFVTGTFDDWTKSHKLTKVGDAFENLVELKGTHKEHYKFVVDGNWVTDRTAPQENDESGNLNNFVIPEQMFDLHDGPPTTGFLDLHELLLSTLNNSYDLCEIIRSSRRPRRPSPILDALQKALATTKRNLQYKFSQFRSVLESQVNLGDDISRPLLETSLRGLQSIQYKLSSVAYGHEQTGGFQTLLSQLEILEADLLSTFSGLKSRLETTPIVSEALHQKAATGNDPGYGPDQIIWRGDVNMDSIAKIQAFARQIGGRTLSQDISWSDLLQPGLKVAGRIDREKANEYLSSLRYSNSVYVVAAVRIFPDGGGASDGFLKLYEYFQSRDRYGVLINKGAGNIRDTYLVPVPPNPSDLPEFIVDLRGGHFVPQIRPEPMLLVVIVFRPPPSSEVPSISQEIPSAAETQDSEAEGIFKDILFDEVCYGRVAGASVAYDSFAPDSLAALSRPWPRVVLQRSQHDRDINMNVLSEKGNKIGLLDPKTSGCIMSLIASKVAIRTAARVNIVNLTPDDPESFDLTVYGPRKNAFEVGERFFEKHCPLQAPRFTEPGVEFCNPYEPRMYKWTEPSSGESESSQPDSGMKSLGSKTGVLRVHVDRARSLPNRAAPESQNPFVRVELDGQFRETTSDHVGGETPLWDEKLQPIEHYSNSSNQLKVGVLSRGVPYDMLIGEAELDLAKLLGTRTLVEGYFPLTRDAKAAGEIKLALTFDINPLEDQTPPEEEEDELLEIGDQLYGREEVQKLLAHILTTVPLKATEVRFGKYQNTTSGAEIVEYIRIYMGKTNVGMAEAIGQDLISNGFLRSIDSVSNLFVNSSTLPYQWQPKAFKWSGVDANNSESAVVPDAGESNLPGNDASDHPLYDQAPLSRPESYAEDSDDKNPKFHFEDYTSLLIYHVRILVAVVPHEVGLKASSEAIHDVAEDLGAIIFGVERGLLSTSDTTLKMRAEIHLAGLKTSKRRLLDAEKNAQEINKDIRWKVLILRGEPLEAQEGIWTPWCQELGYIAHNITEYTMDLMLTLSPAIGRNSPDVNEFSKLLKDIQSKLSGSESSSRLVESESKVMVNSDADELEWEDPWSIAKNRFVDGLDDDAKDIFNTASAENAFQATSDNQSESARNSKLRLRSLARILEDCEAAVHLAHEGKVHAHLSILYLHWIRGSIRVTLVTANKNPSSSFYNDMLDMFTQIGDILPRPKDYEKYDSRKYPRLTQAISTAYLEIISLCTELKPLLKAVAVSSSVTPYAAMDQLAWAVARFRQHRKKVDQEAAICRISEEANADDHDSLV